MLHITSAFNSFLSKTNNCFKAINYFFSFWNINNCYLIKMKLNIFVNLIAIIFFQQWIFENPWGHLEHAGRTHFTKFPNIMRPILLRSHFVLPSQTQTKVVQKRKPMLWIMLKISWVLPASSNSIVRIVNVISGNPL